MKKFLVLIIMVLLLFSFADPQNNNIGWSSRLPDTLAGADSLYFTSPAKIPKCTGVVSFTYLTTNIVDQCNNIIMQGSMDNSTWIDVATEPSPATSDSTMQDANPNYLYYRLFMSTPAADSVQVDAINFIYKEE